jgi:hypothetical protein
MIELFPRPCEIPYPKEISTEPNLKSTHSAALSIPSQMSQGKSVNTFNPLPGGID